MPAFKDIYIIIISIGALISFFSALSFNRKLIPVSLILAITFISELITRNNTFGFNPEIYATYTLLFSALLSRIFMIEVKTQKLKKINMVIMTSIIIYSVIYMMASNYVSVLPSGMIMVNDILIIICGLVLLFDMLLTSTSKKLTELPLFHVASATIVYLSMRYPYLISMHEFRSVIGDDSVVVLVFNLAALIYYLYLSLIILKFSLFQANDN